MGKYKYTESELEQESLMKEYAKEIMKDKKEILIGKINLGGKIMSNYWPRRYYKGKCKVVIYKNDCEYPCFHLVSKDGSLHLPIRIYEPSYDDYQHAFGGKLNKSQRKKLDKWLSSPSIPDLHVYSNSVWDDIRILWDMNNDTNSLYYKFKKTYVKPNYKKQLSWNTKDYMYGIRDLVHDKELSHEELGFTHDCIPEDDLVRPLRHTRKDLYQGDINLTGLGKCAVYIYDGEWIIPHFHIIPHENKKFKCCVRTFEPYYYSHGGEYTDTLTEMQKSELVEAIGKIDTSNQYDQVSIWDRIARIQSSNLIYMDWITDAPANYEKYKTKIGNPKMPDYTKMKSFKNKL